MDRALVEGMTQALAHRGPDGSGYYVSGGIGLGHRRLSIIDIEGGAQPITNEDDTLQVVFNGEIYNFIELRRELEEHGHLFRTRSDTEVIVHAYEEWGSACVERFNGIFAFALWDEHAGQLLLARDHLGVKPLYYSRLNDRLIFASEIKALLVDPQCPRQINLAALAKLFTLRFVPSPETLFQGIEKLPPGHLLRADASGISVHKYWQSRPELLSEYAEDDIIGRYRALLVEAVRLQMRSDVPVGLFLSSGVDSAALLALMAAQTSRAIQTFTIGFEGGEARDETQDARHLAQMFGARHVEMSIGRADYESYYERFLWDVEEPVGHESAPAFYFVSQLASREVKVALCGQGADEPWAGYSRYVGVKLSTLYSRIPKVLSDGLVRGLVERFSRNERLRRGVRALSHEDALTRFVSIYSFFDAEMKGQLFQPWLRDVVSVDGREAREALGGLYREVSGLDALTQILFIDTRASLPDDLLMVADKTSMANSLEVRVPYLDKRLVQLIETLPPRLKLRSWKGKYLHKKALSRWVSGAVINRPKKGFDNPMETWLRHGMRRYVNDCLLSDHSAVRKYFSVAYIKDILNAHESGNRNFVRHLHLLVSFELWHQRFISR